MELSEFEQMDMGLARVAAAQQLGLMISKTTGQLIADVKLANGRWRCYVPGSGWFQASDLLFAGRNLPAQALADLVDAGGRLPPGARLLQCITKRVAKCCK